MSAVTYFLNAGLNTELSSFGLKCLSRINKRIKQNHVIDSPSTGSADGSAVPLEDQGNYIKLPKYQKESIFYEALFDLIEIYYFNEEGYGLLIDGERARILDLENPPNEIIDDPNYEANRKIWFTSIRQTIKKLNRELLVTLRKPHDLHPMTLETELYLADEISESIEKFGYRLIRGSSGRWLIQRLDI